MKKLKSSLAVKAVAVLLFLCCVPLVFICAAGIFFNFE